MSKVITFSRFYPKYHPKAGQPTHFIEQIFASIFKDEPSKFFDAKLGNIWLDPFITGVKNHTIRGGNRFKVGDKFSPRVWSGNPYNSKQIIIAPDIEVKKIWTFEISATTGEYAIDGMLYKLNDLKEVSKNDGFNDVDDFELWFNVKQGEGFKGQIICWNDKIEY